MAGKVIIIGSDHGGFTLKQELITFLESLDFQVEDMGTHSTESVDYPDIAKGVCEKVLQTGNLGILICGTGIGMSISANKIKGIRAGLVHTEYEAEKAKQHNNCNILCLGGRILGNELAKSCVKKFLESEFEGEKHQRRIDKIE